MGKRGRADGDGRFSDREIAADPPRLTVAEALLRKLERLVDRLPKAVQLRNGAYGRNTRAGIDLLLADRTQAHRDLVLSGVIRHRLINRSIFHAHTLLPLFAKGFAKLVPMVGAYRSMISDSTTPLIVATAHFGPLFFATLVMEPLLRGRRVIVVLRDGALYLRRIVPYLTSLGFEYMIDSPASVRVLARALQEDRRTIVLFAFDNPHRGRHHVGFLNFTIATSTGIAYLAETGGAKIVTMRWHWHNARPHIAFDHLFVINWSLGTLERRRLLMSALYRKLEEWILASPEQWSGWDYIAERAITKT